jgi:hypothetical protein
MTTADWIALVAALAAFGSFLAALGVYRSQKRMSQAAETARLHQMWWGDEFREIRTTVFSFVDEWEKNEKRITSIIKSYKETTSDFEQERRAVARVAFFFADLNAMIDAKLVDENFAYRIFGDAQFFWFSEFLLAIANEIELRRRSTAADDRRVVRWVKEVRELDQRFRRMSNR